MLVDMEYSVLEEVDEGLHICKLSGMNWGVPCTVTPPTVQRVRLPLQVKLAPGKR